jgi:hypothetical protein
MSRGVLPRASPMFHRLPGATLSKGHLHQCKKGFSCNRVLSQNTPSVALCGRSHSVPSGPAGGPAEPEPRRTSGVRRSYRTPASERFSAISGSRRLGNARTAGSRARLASVVGFEEVATADGFRRRRKRLLVRLGGLAGDHVHVVGDLHFLGSHAGAEHKRVVATSGGLPDVGQDAVARSWHCCCARNCKIA